MSGKIFKISIVIFNFFLFLLSESNTNIIYNNPRFTLSENRKLNKESRLDINSVAKGEILAAGLSSSYVDKILEYREITGGFSELIELKRISGIGDKNYKKIADYFFIESKPKKERLAVNRGDEKTLKYFGLSKKMIKSLLKNREKGVYISNNIDLKDILNSEKLYVDLRDRVDYGL